MSTATAQAVNWDQLISSWWWLIFFIPGILAGAVEWVAECFGVGLRSHHQRKLEILRAQAKIEKARRQPHPIPPALAVPGPCRHRKAVPVRNGDGDVLAWLCRACDTQLPADFSIYQEDL